MCACVVVVVGLNCYQCGMSVTDRQLSEAHSFGGFTYANFLYYDIAP